MEMLQRALAYLTFSVELYFASRTFLLFNRRRHRFWALLICSVLASIAIAFGCGALHQLEWYAHNLDFISYTLLSVLVWLFFLLAIDEGPKKIVFSLVAGVCLRMGGSWVATLVKFFLPPLSGVAPTLIRLAVILISYLPCCLLVRRLFANDTPFQPRTSDLIFVMVAIALLFPMAYLQNPIKSDGTHWYIYFVIANIVICYSIVVIELLNYRNFRERYAVALENESRRAQLEQYENLGQVINSLNIAVHDMKHQLRDSSLKTVEDAVLDYEDYVRTGYDKLDVILTEKKMSARRLGAAFKAVIAGSDFTFLSLEDLYSLFGNLLDNALESNAGAKEGAERFIAIRSQKNGNFLYLSVSNYADANIRWTADHRPLTSKKEKALHGFGTQSIIRVSKRYGGMASFEQKDSVFTVQILFPLSQNKAN